MSENVDWESVKTKYDDILTLMLQELPDTAEEAQKSGKDYPHTKEKITKKVMTSKLKAICIKFREAVDLAAEVDMAVWFYCIMSCVRKYGAVRQPQKKSRLD